MDTLLGDSTFKTSSSAASKCIALIVVGMASFGLGFVLNTDPAYPMSAWLVGAFLTVGFALCAAFHMALAYLTRASWPVVFRRLLEAMAGYLQLGFLVIAVLLFGLGSLYHEWASPHADGSEHAKLIAGKSVWLNRQGFTIRLAIYFAIWIFFTRKMIRNSRLQDVDGSIEHNNSSIRTSAVFMPLFALSLTFASYDWYMSVDPTWFSTMYAVYQFAGIFLGGSAAITLLLIVLRRMGYFQKSVTVEHFHNMGLWIFATSMFWGYIWFFQFMLIWYANIPEETQYFLKRSGDWSILTFGVVPLLNFGLPFFLSMPQPRKRSENFLLFISIVVLCGRWLDLWVGVAPTVGVHGEHEAHGPTLAYALMSLGTTLGFIGLFFYVVFKKLEQAPLYPLKDPYFEESLHHHT